LKPILLAFAALLFWIDDAGATGDWSIGIWETSFARDGRTRELELSLVVPAVSHSYVGSGRFGVAGGRARPITVTGWSGADGERLVFSVANGTVFDLTQTEPHELAGVLTSPTDLLPKNWSRMNERVRLI